jgi:glycosyltransferase involved in cell wall biosynthesis
VNVLQVTPTNVYPPSDGGQHRSHGLVSALHGDGDAVYRYCQGGHLANYRTGKWKRKLNIDDGYVEFQHLNPVFDLTRSPELFGLPNVFLGSSLRLLRPSPLVERIDWADVILVELPWQVPAVADLADSTPVVYSSHNVEQERFETTADGVGSGWFTAKVTAVERAALERSTAVVCTSRRDAAEYGRRYDVDATTFVAPNGISERALSDPESDAAAGDRVRDRHGIHAQSICLFVGTDYGPNREAVRSVVRVAEEALERGLDAEFVVVGSVGESVETSPENVTVTGFVPELEPYFAAADVGLNPIRSGSGTNIKLLEYLAHGLPVVTTPFGARGFDVADGEEVLVADPSAFLDAVTTVLSDEGVRRHLAQTGRAYVRRNHTWERISAELRERLVELRADAR